MIEPISATLNNAVPAIVINLGSLCHRRMPQSWGI